MQIVSIGNKGGIGMSLTRDEREFAAEYLVFTKKMLIDSLAGLSKLQMEVRPGPFQWSIAECVGHLALAGDHAWKVLQDLLLQPPTPEKQAQVRVRVKQIMV